MTIHEKLLAIQTELKAPKGQRNAFGNYNYRSCEDILEALKPLLNKHNCHLTLSDEVVLIGTRFYVKAKATLVDAESKNPLEARGFVETVAYARESEDKKGMDSAQITGAASSYARKYALNGLFCIDDTKDADTMDNTQEGQKPSAAGSSSKPASPKKEQTPFEKPKPASTDQIARIHQLADDLKMDVQKDIYTPMKIKVGELPNDIQARAIIERLEQKLKNALDKVATQESK